MDGGPSVARDALGTAEGTVEAFDERRGLGTVRGADATVYPFHCTQVADGTRTIPTGVAVRFVVVAGHRGRLEAAAIERR
jgi:CspA family cold shock protein